jgi:hypothetical protein
LYPEGIDRVTGIPAEIVVARKSCQENPVVLIDPQVQLGIQVKEEYAETTIGTAREIKPVHV